MPRPEPWPGVRFGNVDASKVDWRARAAETDFDPDDEELAETPEDVVRMLGFDPRMVSDSAKALSETPRAAPPSHAVSRHALPGLAEPRLPFRASPAQKRRTGERLGQIKESRQAAKGFEENQPRDEPGIAGDAFPTDLLYADACLLLSIAHIAGVTPQRVWQAVRQFWAIGNRRDVIPAGQIGAALTAFNLTFGDERHDLMFESPNSRQDDLSTRTTISQALERIETEPDGKRFLIETDDHFMAWADGRLVDAGDPDPEARVRTVTEIVALAGNKVAKGSPDQPRDEHGRWAGGGSSAFDVKVVGVGSRINEVADAVHQGLARVPSEHADLLSGIKVKVVDEIKVGAQTRGLFSSQDNTITIARSFVAGSNRYFIKNADAVVVHEVGHALDKFHEGALGAEFKSSIDRDAKALTADERAAGSYFLNDQSEKFAELYSLTYSGPSGKFFGMPRERAAAVFAKSVNLLKTSQIGGDEDGG